MSVPFQTKIFLLGNTQWALKQKTKIVQKDGRNVSYKAQHVNGLEAISTSIWSYRLLMLPFTGHIINTC